MGKTNSTDTRRIAFADIGNSRIKIKFGMDLYKFDVHSGSALGLRPLIIEHGINSVFYSSVNKSNAQTLRSTLPEECEAVCIGNEIITGANVDFSMVSGIGSDRALGLVAAARLHEPPLITVDCGTASTVNVLDAEYRCLGGVIMPGIQTQIDALATGTDQLPRIKAEMPERASGRNTNDAIASGTVLASCLSICGIIRRIADEEFSGKMPHVIVTGGFGRMVSEGLLNLGIRNSYVEDLVLDGIEIVAERIIESNE